MAAIGLEEGTKEGRLLEAGREEGREGGREGALHWEVFVSNRMKIQAGHRQMAIRKKTRIDKS